MPEKGLTRTALPGWKCCPIMKEMGGLLRGETLVVSTTRESREERILREVREGNEAYLEVLASQVAKKKGS